MRGLAKVLVVVLVLVECLSGQTRKVSSDEADRRLVRRVRAAYPAMAQIAHISGNVTLQLSETGDVTDVQPVSGHPLFTEPAVKAVRQWRYTPFEFGGRRIAVVTTVVISFPKGLPLTTREKEKNKEMDQLVCGCGASSQPLAAAPGMRKFIFLYSSSSSGAHLS